MAYDTALAVLADPTRRAVMERLAKAPCSAGELSGDFKVSRPAVSQHLRVLRESGFVTVARQGTRRVYSARPEALGELRAYLEGLWDDILAQLGEPEDG